MGVRRQMLSYSDDNTKKKKKDLKCFIYLDSVLGRAGQESTK